MITKKVQVKQIKIAWQKRHLMLVWDATRVSRHVLIYRPTEHDFAVRATVASTRLFWQLVMIVIDFLVKFQ